MLESLKDKTYLVMVEHNSERLGEHACEERDNTDVEPHDLRSKFHLDVRRSLSDLRDLRLLVAQLMLQLSELPALELFQSGYTIV
ncbi:hypothetical protein PC128_g16493 [Phytophthora cactorum]|nr:hypothetical protein PC120_g18695 [Phytophthora cactorum]KAG3049619.1 hypothetical protein PC121_g18841 [Phytophthora cactorum]KAG3178214.1 hypothetical protein PC128_g16493 [Phytophthora cactorum]KAG4051062.1 hypothetical protein PC123_g13705 [Phytophthora cactorum]